MANILFIGPYLQRDGWGSAARDYVQALIATGHNLTIRPLYMSRVPGEQPTEEQSKLERNIYDHYDLVIQNALPHFLDYNAKFTKNVGLFYTETGKFQHTTWPSKMSHMDEVWAPSNADLFNIKSSGSTVPTVRIPIPLDTTKFQRSYDKLPLLDDQNFKFYFIGEYNQRKNLAALVKAYHMEFHPDEPVSLVIKTYINGMDDHALEEKLSNDLMNIRKNLRLYRDPHMYHQEILVISRMSELEMCKLHNTCDCFVMPSHGESWCRPALDALGFGKTPIVTNHTGMSDFVNDSNGYLIESRESPVMVTDPPFPDLYTGREIWRDPDIMSLRKCMRAAYAGDNTTKKNNGMDLVYDYSYDAIARLINDHTY